MHKEKQSESRKLCLGTWYDCNAVYNFINLYKYDKSLYDFSRRERAATDGAMLIWKPTAGQER